MTRGVREQIQKHSDQALNDLKRACENLDWLIETYAPVHPEHARLCISMRAAIEQVARVLVQFFDERG